MRIRLSTIANLGVCLLLLAFLARFGYWPSYAQQRPSSGAVAQAVTDSQQSDALLRIRDELTSMGLRLAAQDQELRAVENAISRMQGVGLGLGGSLMILNIVQFVLSLRRRKE